MIDIAVPNTHNLAKTITDKRNKYQELANEICAIWKQNAAQVILIVISSKRLRWSRGSALPLSTQFRGFKPGRNRLDFQGRKILSAPSFGGEVKPSVPGRRFTACKRFLNVDWKSTFRQNYRLIFSPTSSTFRCLDLSRRVDEEE